MLKINGVISKDKRYFEGFGEESDLKFTEVKLDISVSPDDWAYRNDGIELWVDFDEEKMEMRRYSFIRKNSGGTDISVAFMEGEEEIVTDYIKKQLKGA